MKLSERGYLTCPKCEMNIPLEKGERDILRQAENGEIFNVDAHCGNCKYKGNFREWERYIDNIEAKKFFLGLRK